MRLHRYCWIVVVGLGCLLPALRAADPQASEKKPAAGKFLRVQRDAKGQPTALETAVVRYVPASGDSSVAVDLIGAVHVADEGYYQKLNSHMEQYDVVLFELVASPGTRIPKGGPRDKGNPLALIQKLMKAALKLESQTEKIDYTRKNFVHADLSPEQMLEAMKERGEDGWTLALGIAADLLRQQNLAEKKKQEKQEKLDRVEEDIDLFALFSDPEGPVKLKRLMAQQFEDLEGPGGGLGQTLSTLLITDRNAAAVKVLQQELAKGKKKIGIFYGAAHMPDFEKRLLADFGLKRKEEVWLTAWDLKNKGEGDLFQRNKK
jgi:hypothetical protein